MQDVRNNRYMDGIMKRKKNGQIEIFGLAVIVILISIGFLIFVSFRSSQQPDNPQKEFTNDKLASDFVLSIVDVNIKECPTYNVRDMIIDCARDHRLTCGTTDSCLTLNDTVNALLDKTFGYMNMKYRFYSENLQISDGAKTAELFNRTRLGCDSESGQGQGGATIISLYPDPRNVYLNINICN